MTGKSALDLFIELHRPGDKSLKLVRADQISTVEESVNIGQSGLGTIVFLNGKTNSFAETVAEIRAKIGAVLL